MSVEKNNQVESEKTAYQSDEFKQNDEANIVQDNGSASSVKQSELEDNKQVVEQGDDTNTNNLNDHLSPGQENCSNNIDINKIDYEQPYNTSNNNNFQVTTTSNIPIASLTPVHYITTGYIPSTQGYEENKTNLTITWSPNEPSAALGHVAYINQYPYDYNTAYNNLGYNYNHHHHHQSYNIITSPGEYITTSHPAQVQTTNQLLNSENFKKPYTNNSTYDGYYTKSHSHRSQPHHQNYTYHYIQGGEQSTTFIPTAQTHNFNHLADNTNTYKPNSYLYNRKINTSTNNKFKESGKLTNGNNDSTTNDEDKINDLLVTDEKSKTEKKQWSDVVSGATSGNLKKSSNKMLANNSSNNESSNTTNNITEEIDNSKNTKHEYYSKTKKANSV